MAKPVQVTCRHCKKKIDRDTAYSQKERIYFCDESCCNEYYNKDECGQLELFLDYVWSLYDREYQTTEKYMMIRKQAEHYHNEYGFKYKGMLLAARWYIETLEHKWRNEFGLGQLLPSRYEELRQQYNEHKRLKNTIENNLCNPPERIVVGSSIKPRCKELRIDDV